MGTMRCHFSFVRLQPKIWLGRGQPYECGGGKEGSIIWSERYMHHLIEAPQHSFICGGLNNWPLALMRSRIFAPRCYIQYQRLFYDPYRNSTYLEF